MTPFRRICSGREIGEKFSCVYFKIVFFFSTGRVHCRYRGNESFLGLFGECLSLLFEEEPPSLCDSLVRRLQWSSALNDFQGREQHDFGSDTIRRNIFRRIRALWKFNCWLSQMISLSNSRKTSSSAGSSSSLVPEEAKRLISLALVSRSWVARRSSATCVIHDQAQWISSSTAFWAQMANRIMQCSFTRAGTM